MDVERVEKPETRFEDLFSVIGGFGRYPVLLTAFMSYVTVVVGFQQFIQTYYGSAPNFQCIPDDANASSSCAINKCGCPNCTVVFDDEFTSAVSEWNLICERGHLKAMTQAVYMTGLLVGSVGFGKFSDHFGRRPTTFVCLFLMAVFGFGSTFANSLTLFAVMRFGSGFATAGALLVRFVYVMEVCTLSLRTLMGILSSLFIIGSAVLLALVAFVIRDWRSLMLAVTLIGIPPLFLWKWVPESPSWLIAKGRLQDAQKVLESFAAASGKAVDSEQLSSLIQDVKDSQLRDSTQKSEASILDLVKTPRMRKRMLILSYNWFVNSILFYGITLNAKNLGGSFHLNVFILFAVGFPGVLALWVALKRFGRRIGYTSFMLLGGLVCLMVLAVPTGGHPATKVLASFGVFCFSASFCCIYIYTSELNPTLLRNVSVGVSSMMSRFGGIIAPYIVFLNDTMQNLPLIVFGALAFSAGIMALFLPETLYSPMPQTVEQVETWDEDYGVPCRRKNRSKAREEIVADTELEKLTSDEMANNINGTTTENQE